ncbi:aminomethyl transferase family protein, partial [Mesorhizobium sp. M7A.F.Ca.CA.001.06.1.1]
FGHLRREAAETGTELTLKWNKDGVAADVRAHVVGLPFLSLKRAAN